MSEQLVQGADHTPRTKLIAQALQARQKALRIHKKPQEEIPTNDMMSEIVSSLKEKFCAEHIPPTRIPRTWFYRIDFTVFDTGADLTKELTAIVVGSAFNE